jgi:hypothetical protein
MVDSAFGGLKLSVGRSEIQLIQAHLSQIQTRIRWEVFGTVRFTLKWCTFGLDALKLTDYVASSQCNTPQLPNQLKFSVW